MESNYLLVETAGNRYLYDSLTSKIVLANDLLIEILNNFDDERLLENRALCSHKEFEKTYNLVKDMVKSGMFIKQEQNMKTTEIDYNAGASMSLIIVLTGKCNLRCEYCVYNSKYPHEIGYQEEDMTFDVAKKAIDQYFAFYQEKRKHGFYKKPAILFYGGEPLIMMDLIREIVDYIDSIDFDCDFYMTTNGVLLNEEISKYFVEKQFRITFSLDGNMWNHDRNRIDVNGNPTYNRILNNIIKYEQIKIKEGKSDIITSFNCCYDDYTDLEECVATFVKYGELLRPFYVVYSYISPYDTTYYKWLHEQAEEKGWKKGMLIESYSKIKDKFVKGLFQSDDEKAAIQNLLLSLYATDIRTKGTRCSELNNCCIPLSKLAVYPDGTYTVCEKMNKKLPIGDVYGGIDSQKLDHVTNMMSLLFRKGKCSECSYKRLCNACFQFMNEDGEINNEFCNRSKITIMQQLKDYCELREQYPKIMEKFQPNEDSMELINILS